MRKTLFTIALLSIYGLGVQAFEPTLDDGVIVLNDSNFDEAINHYDSLLVEFYAPWCGHCKSLAPEYAKAAKQMATWDPPQYLAKVDATENKSVAARYEVKGFPTLHFFRNGQRSDYTGGRNEATILSWIKKKTGPPSEAVTASALAAKKGNVKKAIAYVGPLEGKLFDLHMEAAKSPALADTYEFYHTSETSAFDEFDMSGAGIVVLRNFDEPIVHYTGAHTFDALKEFALAHVTARLINFDEDSIEPIFGKKNSAIMLFSNQKDQDYQRVFAEAANKLQGKILFVKSTTTDGIQQKLADYVGVDAKAAPTIRVIKFADDDIVKYRYEGSLSEMTVESLSHFIDEFKAGSLKPFLKSENIPENNNGPVKVIVGHTWNEIVADPTKDVLVKYYAPWCGHCKSLAPIWTELGQFVEGLEDVVIAKMDSTANEVPGVSVKSYPTLIWYPKGNKKGTAYSGGRELSDLKDFLDTNSASYREWNANKGGSGNGAQEEL